MRTALTTYRELSATPHVPGVSFQCGACGEVKRVSTNSLTTGYGWENHKPSPTDKPICYACCGERDRRQMVETGKAVLYLTCEPASKMSQPEGRLTLGKVSNWPGTLEFFGHTRVGRHNFTGVRYDVWFTGPDGDEWHGVTYGDNTQICHCRRNKNRV